MKRRQSRWSSGNGEGVWRRCPSKKNGSAVEKKITVPSGPKIALQGQLRLPSSKVWRTLCWVLMVLSSIIHRNYHCRASLLASSSFNGYSAPMALATAKPEVQAKSWPLPGEVLSSSLNKKHLWWRRSKRSRAHGIWSLDLIWWNTIDQRRCVN